MSELETILRLVAEGHLTPDEAAPIIEALSEQSASEPASRPSAPPSQSRTGGRQVRIKVSEKGRDVVNLRIPLAFADMAMRMLPGLSGQQAERIRAAIDSGVNGAIIDVEDPDGDSVLISVE